MRVAAIALFTGCAGPWGIPDAVEIDSRFSTEQQAVVLDALDAWGDKTFWWPVITIGDRPTIVLDSRYARHGKRKDQPAFNDNDNGNLYLDAASPFVTNATTLWVVVAHEVGHGRLPTAAWTGTVTRGEG